MNGKNTLELSVKYVNIITVSFYVILFPAHAHCYESFHITCILV